MKINFKEIGVKDIEGKTIDKDFSKEVGNSIFAGTKDLGELELAREIYQHGEVEIGKDQAMAIRSYVQRDFYAWAQEAIVPILDEIINQNV